MAAVGICGTDLHMVKGEWERPTPMVLGHEGSGVVEAVGDGVARVAVGDEVVLSWAPSCGKCADCKRGRPAACLTLQYAIGGGTLLDGTTGMTLDGEPLYRGTATGALTERLVVSEQVALPLGDGVPLEEAALLGCAALTGVGAVLFAGQVEAGSTVLVVGAGGVGQFIVQGARIAGASHIVCVDPNEERLDLVRRLGATHVAQPDGLRALMQDDFPDGVDYTFDAVGDPETTKTAFRWTRNGGLCVIVGLPAAGARLELDPTEFIRREKRLTGTIYGSEDPAVALPGAPWSMSARARSTSARSSARSSPSTMRTTPWRPHWQVSPAASSSAVSQKWTVQVPDPGSVSGLSLVSRSDMA